MSVLAWHFTGATLRDGRAIPPVGETLRHDGELVACKSGLHASVRLLDALDYAPDLLLHRVRCGGEIIQKADKLVCTERTILWSHRVSDDLLRRFARERALSAIHLWDAPDVVRQYLETGDETLRAAASDAANAAAWDAARAASDAALAAARAASDAALAAALAAARDARDAANAAAWDARDAAWAAARDAAWAASDAANASLTALVLAEAGKTEGAE
ncbi:MAG: hypothetical protein AB7K73_15140 [Gammaproteobacteria bacterium]